MNYATVQDTTHKVCWRCLILLDMNYELDVIFLY
jgi:hypothetical protein